MIFLISYIVIILYIHRKLWVPLIIIILYINIMGGESWNPVDFLFLLFVQFPFADAYYYIIIIIIILVRMPVYFKKSRGGSWNPVDYVYYYIYIYICLLYIYIYMYMYNMYMYIIYFSSSSNFRLPPSKIRNWGG